MCVHTHAVCKLVHPHNIYTVYVYGIHTSVHIQMYADRSRQANEFIRISNINMGEKVENEQFSCMQQHTEHCTGVVVFILSFCTHTHKLIRKQYRL